VRGQAPLRRSRLRRGETPGWRLARCATSVRCFVDVRETADRQANPGWMTLGGGTLGGVRWAELCVCQSKNADDRKLRYQAARAGGVSCCGEGGFVWSKGSTDRSGDGERADVTSLCWWRTFAAFAVGCRAVALTCSDAGVGATAAAAADGVRAEQMDSAMWMDELNEELRNELVANGPSGRVTLGRVPRLRFRPRGLWRCGSGRHL
jgi:hypothetical protein